jgi:uncharacterized protein (DUF1330 family)
LPQLEFSLSGAIRPIRAVGDNRCHRAITVTGSGQSRLSTLARLMTRIGCPPALVWSYRFAAIATPGKQLSANWGGPMKTNYKVAVALVAGAALGGAAIQGLHAQAKPPAYVVIPILKINDAAAFKAGVLDKASATAAVTKAEGGHYIVRSQKFIRLDGNPPQRLIIIKFDSVEKAQAYENSAVLKEVTAARMKSTNSLSFIVEGTTD